MALFVFVIAVVGATGFACFCWWHCERDTAEHRKATHTLQIQQAEVARRWRERQMEAADNVGKHAFKQ